VEENELNNQHIAHKNTIFLIPLEQKKILHDKHKCEVSIQRDMVDI
jgi:hypothetical protein